MNQQDVYAGLGSIAYALVKLSGLPRILREAATGETTSGTVTCEDPSSPIPSSGIRPHAQLAVRLDE